MLAQIRASFVLLVATVIVCCVIYPGVLLIVGQTVFPGQAEGSLVYDRDGKAIGSRLIAQPFNGDEYFHPRPSAASYDGSASGASNWAANNYLLRDRVARQLGPIVKYASGLKKEQLVAPDVEAWFAQDRYQGQVGIVAQWAQAHSTLAQNWVKADPLNKDYVEAWRKAHSADVERWKKENPDQPEPKAEDLAVPFFSSFSAAHPGRFPVATEHPGAGGKTEKSIEPSAAGADIQSIFFDMWRQEHTEADLEPVPADMVMASGSGLDPHITVKNAIYQLPRVVAKWAAETHRDPAQIRSEIEGIIRDKTEAPMAGLVGVDLVNVLEVNLELENKYRHREPASH
jgi:K+-transporting ATPase ATPase C chain